MIGDQRWRPYAPKAGPAGIRGVASGLCLTASSAGRGGAEVHDYGAVSFLSNYAEHATLSVEWQGRSYHLPNHTVCIVDSASGVVVWNSSDVWAHAPRPPPRQQHGGISSASKWLSFVETPGYGSRTVYGA